MTDGRHSGPPLTATLALAAQWFTREPPGTQRHAEPLTRARLRALTTELETLE